MLLKILILSFPLIASAAGGGHGGGGIPGVIIYQVINLSILIGIIIYFTKDSIKSFFASRNSEYLEAAKKSASARAEAEKQLQETKEKIANLDRSREETLSKAIAQAEDLKKQIAAEAEGLSRRIKEDANLTVNLEVQRAMSELRAKLLSDSIEAARVVMTKDLGSNDQQKLQKDFIKNIGV